LTQAAGFKTIRKTIGSSDNCTKAASDGPHRYNLFTQKPKGELADFERWTGMMKSRQGDEYLRHNGAGEMLVFSAADFEDFLEPRPDLTGSMEQDLKPVVTLLAKTNGRFASTPPMTNPSLGH